MLVPSIRSVTMASHTQTCILLILSTSKVEVVVENLTLHVSAFGNSKMMVCQCLTEGQVERKRGREIGKREREIKDVKEETKC